MKLAIIALVLAAAACNAQTDATSLPAQTVTGSIQPAVVKQAPETPDNGNIIKICRRVYVSHDLATEILHLKTPTLKYTWFLQALCEGKWHMIPLNECIGNQNGSLRPVSKYGVPSFPG